MKRSISKRVLSCLDVFYSQIRKAPTAVSLGFAIAAFAAMSAPNVAQAEIHARLCVHIPQGHNFDTDSGFSVLVHTPGQADVNLVLAKTELDPLLLRLKMTMKVGYTCKIFPLGTSGENALDVFQLSRATTIDATIHGDNDFCANELYLQIIQDGHLQTTARFLNPHQRCWGDGDLPGAVKERKNMPVTAFGDERPQPTMVKAVGYWHNVCRSTECDQATTKELGFSQSDGTVVTKETSKTVKKELSVGFAAKGFSASASMSSETTNSVAHTLSRDITMNEVKSTTVNLGYKPEIRNKFSVLSVWEFFVTAEMSDGQKYIVPTGMRACSSTNGIPAFGPGSADIDFSCQGSLTAVTCGVEGGVCKLPGEGTYQVLYGVPGAMVARPVAINLDCSTQNFGGVDPAPGKVKECLVFKVLQ